MVPGKYCSTHRMRPDIMGAPLGRMEIRRTGRNDIMRVERRSTYETIETEKHGYRDDDPCKHPSPETGRDAVCTTTRSELTSTHITTRVLTT